MYNVLIVDDKEIFCRSLVRLPVFKSGVSGFNAAFTAANGVEALQILRTEKIDVTLTDIRMPLMNGIELLKIIQKEHVCRCTILLSEYAEFSYAKAGIINGAFDYLVKPIDGKRLTETFDRVHEYLRQSDSANSLAAEYSERLVDAIIKGEENDLKEEFGRCRQALNVKNIKDVLQLISSEVTLNYPYAAMYLPLKEICTLPVSVKDDAGAYEYLVENAVLMQRITSRFRLNSEHPMIKNVWYYTLSHIEEPCRLQDIAKKFYINKNYLSTLFRKETKMYYKDFVLYFKVERAKVLLLYSDKKICEIADDLQFSNAEYFSRVFKGWTGCTPSEFNVGMYYKNCSK